MNSSVLGPMSSDGEPRGNDFNIFTDFLFFLGLQNVRELVYGFWFPALREKRRLRVFENDILWRIFGQEIDEIEEWRRFHNQ